MDAAVCNAQPTEYVLEPELRLIVEGRLESVHGVRCSLPGDCFKCISKGLGAMCNVFQTSLDWGTSPLSVGDAKLPKTILFKVPRIVNKSELVCKIEQMINSVNQEKSFDDFPIRCFDREVSIYSTILTIGDVPMPRPKCYFAGSTASPFRGTIVLEDMTSSAVLIEDIACGMSCSQVFNICSVLADFHSWCLLNTRLWRGKFPSLFLMADNDSGKQLRAMINGGVAQLKAQFPGRFDNVDDEMMVTYLLKNWPLVVEQQAAVLTEVLNHGDLWTNNILFKPNADGTAGDQVTGLIDWQLSYQGSPMEDVCHLLTWSTNAAFRRKHQRAVVRHYYDRLNSNLAGKVDVPDFHAYWSSYLAIFPSTAFFFTGVFHACIGTVIKCREAGTQGRLEEMLDRVSCAYREAVELANNGR